MTSLEMQSALWSLTGHAPVLEAAEAVAWLRLHACAALLTAFAVCFAPCLSPAEAPSCEMEVGDLRANDGASASCANLQCYPFELQAVAAYAGGLCLV